MSNMQCKRRRQEREARLQIVSTLVLRQHSVRQVRQEVMKRLNLSTYSTQTCHKDIKDCLEEWREDRINNTDLAVQLELERIDATCQELWAQWEKSKEDGLKVKKKHKGVPKFGDEGGGLKITQHEKTEETVTGLGNVSYIAEIRAQLVERRKLLGLYAPEKKEVSGEMSFAALLMESGMLDDAEREAGLTEDAT